MSTSERTDPHAGPFANLNQAYCNGLDVLARGYEPTFKSVGRMNLEVMALATRRGRAWLELPARVSRCKTPQDLVREQVQFWQAAAKDYSEGAQRLTVAFGALAGPHFMGPWAGLAAKPARDYISVPEMKPATDAEMPKRERRAA